MKAVKEERDRTGKASSDRLKNLSCKVFRPGGDKLKEFKPWSDKI